MVQVARHLDELRSFDMDIVYVKGDKNVVADFLSRLPPCNRGPGGEPCKQCTRRMVGHGQCREEFDVINVIGATSGQGTTSGLLQTQGTGLRTRSGRVSVVPKRDSAFDYTCGQARRRAARQMVAIGSRDRSHGSRLDSEEEPDLAEDSVHDSGAGDVSISATDSGPFSSYDCHANVNTGAIAAVDGQPAYPFGPDTQGSRPVVVLDVSNDIGDMVCPVEPGRARRWAKIV